MKINKLEIARTAKSLSPFLKGVFKFFGFDKLIDKQTSELAFQKNWAKEFENNKAKVLEYWQKYRFLDEIKEQCRMGDKTKVLDVGCGISTVLHYIDGKKFGIDPLAEEYQRFYQYPTDINIKNGYGEDINFPDVYFDVIFCSNVLDHVEQPSETVEEIYRVLKVGGYFVLTVEVFDKNITRNAAHPYSFVKNDVFSLFGKKFKKVFEKESSWIGLKRYVNNDIAKKYNKEMIIIFKK